LKQSIYIVGAGGLGREVRAMLGAMPEWEVAGFYDDHKRVGSLIDGITCLGDLTELIGDPKTKNVVIAIGDPKVKNEVRKRLAEAVQLSFPTLIHPSVILQDTARIKLGAGCIITAGCILTTGISMEDHVLINLNVTVGHDTLIGLCSSVMPGVNLAGSVILGKSVLVGSGVNILNSVKVGDYSKIGAGAVVIQDVAEGTTVVGIPARLKHSI